MPHCATSSPKPWAKANWIGRSRAALGKLLDDRPERCTFTLAGRRDAIRLLQTPTAATLVPCPEESVDLDTTIRGVHG